MNGNRTRLLILALMLWTTTALAGPLATDPNAYSGHIDPSDNSSAIIVWHGSTNFQGLDTNNQPTGLTGQVDWAVYAPGNGPAGLAGYVPTPGEYLYAYQVYETGSADLSQLSVALVDPADHIGHFTATGVSGVTPDSEFLIPLDSATWTFGSVHQGGSSVGLAFSSQFVPMFLRGTVVDHGSSADVIPLPSPSANIPEPGTFTLVVCGLAVFALHQLRRRARIEPVGRA